MFIDFENNLNSLSHFMGERNIPLLTELMRNLLYLFSINTAARCG